MNDTTNTPDQAPVAKVTPYQLMDTLGKVLFAHIEALVEAKVNDIMQSHATMALIDEKTDERLREIAKDLMDEHEGDYEHHSTDDISDTVATHLAHIDFSDNIRRSVEEIISDGDYPNEDRVMDIITDYVNTEMNHAEIVKQGLRDML